MQGGQKKVSVRAVSGGGLRGRFCGGTWCEPGLCALKGVLDGHCQKGFMWMPDEQVHKGFFWTPCKPEKIKNWTCKFHTMLVIKMKPNYCICQFMYTYSQFTA
jgi:hypothetical protein